MESSVHAKAQWSACLIQVDVGNRGPTRNLSALLGRLRQHRVNSMRAHALESRDTAMAIQDVAGPQYPAETSTAEIKTTARDGWHATVALYGEIDMAAAPSLRAELDRHLDAGRGFIRIDAAGVTFLDCTALNALVTRARRCAGMHGALILTNVPTRVREIIRITGLETVLLIDTACDERAPYA
jgi:anti-sigma B factor antagonist